MARSRKRNGGLITALCVALVLILLVGFVGWATKGFAGWGKFEEWFGGKKQTEQEAPAEDEKGTAMLPGEVYELPRAMVFRSSAVAQSEAGSSVMLTATVTPDTAENKTVIWTVAWEDAESEFASGKTVTEYVTVTPTSAGALTATVCCLQPFEGKIFVKVQTQDGGYWATCTVTFAGKPTELSLTPSVSAEAGFYNLKSGTTYEWNINVTNPWNQVGSAFHDYEVESVGVGNVIIGNRKLNMMLQPSTPAEWKEGEDHAVRIDEIKVYCAKVSSYIWAPYGDPYEILTVSVSGDKLILQAKNTVESYKDNISNPLGWRYMFKEYENGVEPYFSVTVREKTSGVSRTVKVRVKSTVTGVALNDAAIEF